MAPSNPQKQCRKTRLCRFQEAGHCSKGSACRFAHSYEEIRKAPEPLRSRMCPSLAEIDICQDQDSALAHHGNEIHAAPGGPNSHAWSFGAESYWPATPYTLDRFQLSNMPVDWLASMSISYNNSPCKEKPASTLRKTKFCTYHMRGVCNKGAKCSYAHSKEELRPKPRFDGTEAFWGLNRSMMTTAYTDSRLELTPSGCSWSENPDGWESSLDDNSDDLDSAPPSSDPSRPGRQVNQDPAHSQLHIKNTFLHIVDFIPEAPRARSQSLPCRAPTPLP